MRSRPADRAEVEADLRDDWARLPGGLERWESLTPRSREAQLKRLTRAERRRVEFEGALAETPDLADLWRSFPVTEQREVLGTIDYLRFWPRKWSMRQAIRGVRRGSDYRRGGAPPAAPTL